MTKILVIDDDDDTRSMLRFSLKHIGFPNVSLAQDGAEGVRMLETQRFDLILCDWNMPKMSGIEVLKHVRSSPTGKITPFIMLTAEGSKERVMEALEGGVTDYIVKPWTTDTLTAKLAPWNGKLSSE